MGELNEEFRVDLSKFSRHIKAIDDVQLRQDLKAEAAAAKVRRIELTLGRVEKRASQLNQRMKQVAGAFGRFAAVEIGQELIGDAIPEAVQPLSNIGIATLQGAAIAGPAGAAVAGVATAVSELIQVGRRQQAQIDALAKEIKKAREEFKEAMEQRDAREIRAAIDFDQKLQDIRAEIRKRGEEQLYQAWQLAERG